MAFLENKSLLPSNLPAAEAARCLDALGATRISIGRNLDWPAIFKALQWPHSTALLCDNNTWNALAQKIAESLQPHHRITLVNLGSNPKPDMETTAYLREQAADCEAIIAVGSGTLNDIAKHTAAHMRIPYAVCGTAASMNGYLSANAAITEHGHKKSLAARLPVAALFDLDVMQTAPDRLTYAGIGDSACRSTAQADWLLSHHLLGTPYDPLPFALLQPHEDAMLRGDARALITTLLLSGLGMTLCGGSYPASQGEHLVSHYLEMQHADLMSARLHGEQIAVATLFMSALQHGLLTLDSAPQWQDLPLPDEAFCVSHFGEATGASVWQEWKAKQNALGERAEFNERLAKNWGEIVEDILPVTLPYAAIDRALVLARAPRTAQELNLTKEQFSAAAHHAHLIRNRFTFLDLAFLCGRQA